MKIPKFLLIAFTFTFFSLLYVHQQTEIFRLAYQGQKRFTIFQDLLDKNTILRYNIDKNASLVRIGNRVSGNNNYEIPSTYRLVRSESSEEVKFSQYVHRNNILAHLFEIKKQAEANTINP